MTNFHINGHYHIVEMLPFIFHHKEITFNILFMDFMHFRELLWRRQWHPTPVLLPGKSQDGGAWWAAVRGIAKSWIRLSDFTFTFHFRALEKEMAIHSSVLAWRIPGTGETDGLPSLGSHRVRHD